MRQLSKLLGIGSVILAVLILVSGLWVQNSVHEDLEKHLAEDLVTVRDTNIAALQQWIHAQEQAATLTAKKPEVVELARDLIRQARAHVPAEELANNESHQKLQEQLTPTIENWIYTGYALVADGRIVSASQDMLEEVVGVAVNPVDADALHSLDDHSSTLGRPRYSIMDEGSQKVPLMWVASGVRGEEEELLGVLAFFIDPTVKKVAADRDAPGALASFSEILAGTEFGETGESYAFDKKGLLLTRVRHEGQLATLGLLEDGQHSLLNLTIQDPGIDLTQTALRPDPQGLTVAAKAAARGKTGVNVAGYRNYKGEEVVGAWTWLPEYGFGIVTEIEREEAYASIAGITAMTRGLVGALLFVALLIIGGSHFVSQLGKKADEAERLGQYTLEKKIGEGGMGAVYRARHALLRRPTAVKVIRGAAIDDMAMQRFEREVQATAKLTHPNTIAIYDYGHTAAGVFYYAMEYLEGVTLAELVHTAGPLPQGRVVNLMIQVLGSLAEAHDHKMVHRDIKPANIMVTQRGGVPDLVKVLDFGLVKDVDAQGAKVTVANSITGTPHYMAPEAITDAQSVDARSDIYAVGAVAFYLLTGRLVFEGPTMMAVLTKHLTEKPEAISTVAPRPVHPELERLVLLCLEKQPGDRPARAQELLESLERLQQDEALGWSSRDAAAWWDEHGDIVTAKKLVSVTSRPTLAVDLAERQPPPTTEGDISEAPTVSLADADLPRGA